MSISAETRSDWSPLQWTGAVFAWLWVAVPFAYGLYELFLKIAALFG